MFFLKKSKNQPQETPNKAENLNEAGQAELTESSPEAGNNLGLSGMQGTLLGKLFHKSEFSGPESSYENEAWAPESNFGLFHKRRATAEEQLPPSSGSQ